MKVYKDRFYLVVLDSEGVRLFAFDKETGATEWSTGNYLGSARFSIVDGMLLYYDDNSGIRGRDPSDGSEVINESFELPEMVPSSNSQHLTPPVDGDGTAYTTGVDLINNIPLLGYNLDNNEVEMRAKPAEITDRTFHMAEFGEEIDGFSGLVGLPVVVGDRIIATGYGRNDDGTPGRYCFGFTSNGELDWSVSSELAYAPVAAGDVIYLLTQGSIQTVSADGEQLDTVDIDADTGRGGNVTTGLASPALGNGRLYVPTHHSLVSFE